MFLFNYICLTIPAWERFCQERIAFLPARSRVVGQDIEGVNLLQKNFLLQQELDIEPDQC